MARKKPEYTQKPTTPTPCATEEMPTPPSVTFVSEAAKPPVAIETRDVPANEVIVHTAPVVLPKQETAMPQTPYTMNFDPMTTNNEMLYTLACRQLKETIIYCQKKKHRGRLVVWFTMEDGQLMTKYGVDSHCEGSVKG